MSITALQMRANLRTDLKDSGALWSDAELTRCIQRSVADFNRYLPDEKTYELSLQLTVTGESVTFPATADPDRIVDGVDISATVDGGTLTITAQPDVPRPLVLTITDANASITNLSLIIKGSDKDGHALEETLHWYKGLTTVTGKKYFKTVNEVEVDQIDGNGAGDLLDLGIGAYTDVWVYLANRPVKDASESGTDSASAALTRNTDYYIDYIAGAVKAISGGIISAGEVCTFSYSKMPVGIDLSSLPGLIRVQRVEYPVGLVPQNFVTFDTFGTKLFITGGGEDEEQGYLSEDEQVRVYYDAEHIPPNNFAPGTIPDFLEPTVEMLSGAYALLIKALQYDHAAVSDMTNANTTIALTDTPHTNLGTAIAAASVALVAAGAALDKVNNDGGKTYLTDADGALDNAATALAKVATYLESNSSEDSKYWLTKITTDIAGLRTAILTAVDAANTYLDAVGAASTGDLALGDLEAPKYMGATANYLNGGAEPGVLAYLTSGDALLNTITAGGEGTDVPIAYARYAQATRDALIAPFEKHREFLYENATKRTNAAMVYVQEAAQRLSNLRSYIEQADAWGRVAAGFVSEANSRIAEAQARLSIPDRYIAEAAQRTAAAQGYIAEANSYIYQIDRYIAEVDRYVAFADRNMLIAESFRKDGYERRNEVYSIWRDRKQYIGDFTAGSVRQMPRYKD